MRLSRVFAGRSVRLLFCAALSLSGFAQAQITPIGADVVPASPFPGDRVAISAWRDACGGPAFDPSRPPVITQLSHVPGVGGVLQDEYTYELSYGLAVADELCGTGLFAGFWSNFEIGALPLGHHKIVVKGLTSDKEVYVQYDVNAYVGPANEVRPDVSGVWYSPQQNGRGVSVTRVTRSQGSFTSIYWATHDKEGRPGWVVLMEDRDVALDQSNPVKGTAIHTYGDPLSPGPAELQVANWGQIRFTYERCGHARLEWNAIDPAIQDGSLELVQVIQPDGVYVCDVEKLHSLMPVRWAN